MAEVGPARMTEGVANGDETAQGPGIWSGPYLSMTLANLSIVALVAFDTMALEEVAAVDDSAA